MPTIAGVVLSAAIVLLFFAIFNYLIDAYLMFAASAVTANTICRSALAAASPPFTPQIFDAMGVGGAGSLLAGCATILAPIPFVFYRYGEALRMKSEHASVSAEMAKVVARASRDSGHDGGGDEMEHEMEEGSEADEEMKVGNMGR